MKIDELLSYVKEKGYEVTYRRSYAGNNLPVIDVDGVRLYLCWNVCKFGMSGETTQFSISKKRFDNLLYLVKAHGQEVSKSRSTITLDDTDYWKLSELNNSEVAQSNSEIDWCIKNGMWPDEPNERVLKHRKEELAKRGITWREV